MKAEQLDIEFNKPPQTQTKELRSLEDIPNWQEKLKKYELAQYYIKATTEGMLNFNSSQSAQLTADELNEKYGVGTAMVKDAMPGYRLSVNAPYRNEFEDILDQNGMPLPLRDGKVHQMYTDKKNTA